MQANDARLQKRCCQDASPANQPTETQTQTECPRCGTALVAIDTRGPTTHVAQPCGCEVGSSQLLIIENTNL